MTTSLLALSLSGNFDPGAAVLAGVIGALTMLLVIYGGRMMGMTRMDLLRTLGTMVRPDGSTRTVYGIGLMMHLMMGALFGLVHSGLLVVMAMPMMLDMAHPLVRRGDIEKPGIALTGFGNMTPMGVTIAHVVFGLVASVIYVGIVR